MSTQNEMRNEKLNVVTNNQEPQDNANEFDRWVNDTGPFVRLPAKDGDSILVQFFKDKDKRELITRIFEDPETHEKKSIRRASYKVLVPQHADQGEKSLEVPKTLAQQIELNISRNHCLMEIIRHGSGMATRYNAVVAD